MCAVFFRFGAGNDMIRNHLWIRQPQKKVFDFTTERWLRRIVDEGKAHQRSRNDEKFSVRCDETSHRQQKIYKTFKTQRPEIIFNFPSMEKLH